MDNPVVGDMYYLIAYPGNTISNIKVVGITSDFMLAGITDSYVVMCPFGSREPKVMTLTDFNKTYRRVLNQ